MFVGLLSGKPTPPGFGFFLLPGPLPGSLECVLPIEAKAQGAVVAVSTQWLKEHWKSHVYGGCEACDVTLTNWIWDQNEKYKSNIKE